MAAPRLSELELYVVSVTDSGTEILAGHSGLIYTSPPQPCHDALSLVTGLLCHHPNPAVNDARSGRWTTATAGGRRVVTLTSHHKGDNHVAAARS